MIFDLFPQPIGFYKFGRDLTKKEFNFIRDQKTYSNTGNLISKDTAILHNRELDELNVFIENSLSDYFETIYSPKYEVNLQITQSWCNYTEPGQYHHKHAHPNSFISGVFYPQANRKLDKIYFYRPGFQQISLPAESWNIWNSESWWFEVGTGDLILFSSSLEHMVEPVKGEQTRISLSFNSFPVGNIGEELKVSKLNIGSVYS